MKRKNTLGWLIVLATFAGVSACAFAGHPRLAALAGLFGVGAGSLLMLLREDGGGHDRRP